MFLHWNPPCCVDLHRTSRGAHLLFYTRQRGSNKGGKPRGATWDVPDFSLLHLRHWIVCSPEITGKAWYKVRSLIWVRLIWQANPSRDKREGGEARCQGRAEGGTHPWHRANVSRHLDWGPSSVLHPGTCLAPTLCHPSLSSRLVS